MMLLLKTEIYTALSQNISTIIYLTGQMTYHQISLFLASTVTAYMEEGM